jgi:outer membrane protein assembly factor BamB
VPSETYHLSFESEDPDLQENILAKGTVLEKRYEIVKILGLGGMGSVYLATDLRFKGIDRFCAIKEMTIQSPDPAFRKLAIDKFRNEANTLAKLNHPSIVDIYDFFMEENRVYLVMEYIEGIDLEEVVTALPEGEYLPEAQILNWGIQLCDILTFLHDSKTPIVYRDLKPPNIILRAGGTDTLVLVDFGIAKSFQEGQKGTMMGTEGYSPPEQYKGEASPQGDVYALGATLHHLLTRRDPKLEPPFSFHEAPPRQLNPQVSEVAEQAIMKSLNYNVAERYQSAAEMKTALQAALEGEPGASQGTQMLSTSMLRSQSPAHGQQQMPQPQMPPMQQPMYHPMQYPMQQPGYGPMPQPMYPPAQPYPQQMPDMHAPNLVKSQSDVVPVWSFKCEDEVRSSPAVGNGMVYVGVYDNNLYAVDAKMGKFRWKYPTEGGIASSPHVYRDKVLIGSEDRVIYAISGINGNLIWKCQTEGKIRSSVNVEFDHAFFGSDDGRLYAANAQTGRVVWRFESGGPIQSTPLVDDEIVYVGCEDGHLYALDLRTGKMKWKFRTNRGVISSPTIFQDLVLFGSKDRTFHALDKRTGWSIWKHTTGDPIYSSPSVQDGIVYFGSVDTYLYALDAATGRVQWRYKAGFPIISRPAVSEEAVFFGTTNGEVISVYIKNGQRRWLFQSDGPVPSSPVLGESVIYIGSNDHHLYALPM